MLFDGNGRTYRSLGSAGGGRAAAAGKSKTENHKSLFDASKFGFTVEFFCAEICAKIRRSNSENSDD
jgi:hypothetical protein